MAGEGKGTANPPGRGGKGGCAQAAGPYTAATRTFVHCNRDMADESPLDRFKTALTGAARAIGHDPEAEVAWTSEAPAVQGKSLRVPMPGRALPRDQAAEARGFADSFALRLRHHDEALHRRGMPAEPEARACYDAIERVRYEALGENNYAGMRENLAAATELRTATDPIVRAANAGEVPIQTALALMLREELTGQPAPEAAREGVELVREFVESRTGDDFERLALTIDSGRYSRVDVSAMFYRGDVWTMTCHSAA